MDVRTAILNAATQLFAQRGFDGTPIQAVADSVGIRKPSLLYHFSSKEVLRQAVLENLWSRWTEVLPRLLRAAAHDGITRFDRVVEEVISFFAADNNRARLLVREALDRPEEMRRYLSEYVRPWIGMVAKYIRKGQETEEIHPEVDPESYVLQLISLVLAGFATVESLGVVLGDDAEHNNTINGRHTAELVRIMKTGLFTQSAHNVAEATDGSGEQHNG